MTPTTTERSLLAAAVAIAPISAVTAAVGVAFIVVMFTAFGVGATSLGQAFGWLNDTMVLVSYLLAIPLVVAIHVVLRRQAPTTSAVLATLAILCLVAVVVLQGLLVTGRMAFADEVVPASIAILGFGACLVVVGWIGDRAGVLSNGVRMGIVGATYFGFPIWAMWAGRQLRALGDRGAAEAAIGGLPTAGTR